MDISLKKLFNQSSTYNLKICDRLPQHITSSCDVTCDIIAEPFSRYDLLKIKTTSELDVVCQRCLESFKYNYSQQTQLAVCDNDEVAEELMQDFDCIVAVNHVINLTEILTDDLHLFVPIFHPCTDDCRKDIFVSI